MISYDLKITLDDGDVFLDAMDAQTPEQALQLAYWNWECATHIEIIGGSTLMTYEQYVDEVFIDHHDCMGLDEEETQFLIDESTFKQRERWLRKAGYNLVSMYDMSYPKEVLA